MKRVISDMWFLFFVFGLLLAVSTIVGITYR